MSIGIYGPLGSYGTAPINSRLNMSLTGIPDGQVPVIIVNPANGGSLEFSGLLNWGDGLSWHTLPVPPGTLLDYYVLGLNPNGVIAGGLNRGVTV